MKTENKKSKVVEVKGGFLTVYRIHYKDRDDFHINYIECISGIAKHPEVKISLTVNDKENNCGGLPNDHLVIRDAFDALSGTENSYTENVLISRLGGAVYIRSMYDREVRESIVFLDKIVRCRLIGGSSLELTFISGHSEYFGKITDSVYTTLLSALHRRTV